MNNEMKFSRTVSSLIYMFTYDFEEHETVLPNMKQSIQDCSKDDKNGDMEHLKHLANCSLCHVSLEFNKSVHIFWHNIITDRNFHPLPQQKCIYIYPDNDLEHTHYFSYILSDLSWNLCKLFHVFICNVANRQAKNSIEHITCLIGRDDNV